MAACNECRPDAAAASSFLVAASFLASCSILNFDILTDSLGVTDSTKPAAAAAAAEVAEEAKEDDVVTDLFDEAGVGMAAMLLTFFEHTRALALAPLYATRKKKKKEEEYR